MIRGETNVVVIVKMGQQGLTKKNKEGAWWTKCPFWLRLLLNQTLAMFIERLPAQKPDFFLLGCICWSFKAQTPKRQTTFLGSHTGQGAVLPPIRHFVQFWWVATRVVVPIITSCEHIVLSHNLSEIAFCLTWATVERRLRHFFEENSQTLWSR